MDFKQELILIFEGFEKANSQELLNSFRDDRFFSPSSYHFSLGTHIRNKILLNNPKLVEVFNLCDIHHYDDMSHIIIKNFHRYLNEKKFLNMEK